MLKDYKKRWLKKTGEPMPAEILRLPLKKICKAVMLVEAGVTVVVPKDYIRQEEPLCSMMQHDKHGEFS